MVQCDDIIGTLTPSAPDPSMRGAGRGPCPTGGPRKGRRVQRGWSARPVAASMEMLGASDVVDTAEPLLSGIRGPVNVLQRTCPAGYS